MATLALAVLVTLVAVGGLAVGVLAGRAPLRGSCGGLACSGACASCPRKRDE